MIVKHKPFVFLKRVTLKIMKYCYNNRILAKKSLVTNKEINIFGYFDYIFSISSNARDFVILSGIDLNRVSLVPLKLVAKPVCEDNSLSVYYSYPSKSALVNLWLVSFDLINDCYRKHRKWFDGRYNIAVFWWEFDDYFTNTKSCNFLDEVVVFSSVTYAALQKVVPEHVKLTKLEYPFLIYLPQVSRNDLLASYGLNLTRTYVLFAFDLHSYIERKNPHGVLQAFNLAFQQNKNLHLILKITNFELWRQESQDLLAKIDALCLSNSVTIISDNLAEQEMRELVGGCDIYISLHRAEGLGLGMLEAMSMGKPVIATRFGGNLDFMNDDNSLLVDYTITEVKRSFATYKKGYKWAEPDVSMAANYLLSLSTDKTLYAKIATNAQKSIQAQYSMTKLQNQYREFFSQREII